MKNLNLTIQQQKEITRKNLQRVLNELPLLAIKMPEIKRDFNMTRYGVYNCIKIENLKNCETFGCLLGNISRIFEKEFTNDVFDKSGHFDYHLFSIKFFPYLNTELLYRKAILIKKWAYLFCGDWKGTKFGDLDSSLQRIKNLIANDLECNEFSYKTNQIIN